MRQSINSKILLLLFLLCLLCSCSLMSNPQTARIMKKGNAGIASGVRMGKKIAFILEYLINTDHEYDNEISSQFTVALTYNIP